MRNRQRGFGALEVMIALIITSLMIVAGTKIYQKYLDLRANLNAGEHMNMVADAAAKYIQDNRAAVLAAAGPTTPAPITIGMLRTTGHLPAGFSDKNAYGQDYRVLAIEPTTNILQTLIVTINGDTIPEMSLYEIAKSIGARGGYVSSTNTAVATGSFGGWQTALAPYGVTPGAGHLATALFVDDSSTTNDYLYRNAMPGQPELNEMNTALGMRGNNINNAGAVSATGVSVTGNTNTTGETYTGGWFRTRGDSGWYNEKWVGGWYMSDPTWVRSYANKSVYTGGEMRGGTLRSEGRTTVGEYLQLSGVATEGTACSPNGLVGRNSAGLTLSCQSGVWKAGGGSSVYALGQPGWWCDKDSGYTMQWGAGPALGVDASTYVTFPRAMTAGYSATGTGIGVPSGGNGPTLQVRSLTGSGFIMSNDYYSTSGFYWFATGYTPGC